MVEILADPSKHFEFECLSFRSPFAGESAGEIVVSWLVSVGGLLPLLSRVFEGVYPQMKSSSLKFCSVEIIRNFRFVTRFTALQSHLTGVEPAFTGGDSGSNWFRHSSSWLLHHVGAVLLQAWS